MLWAAPAAAGPKSPQAPRELGAELQSQGYKVQYERIGNCALDSGSVVGTRGGVTWSHDIDHQIAYITVPCKREASRSVARASSAGTIVNMGANMLTWGGALLAGLVFSPVANADNVPDLSDFTRDDVAGYLTAPVQPGRDPMFSLQFRTEDGLFCSLVSRSLVCTRDDGTLPGVLPPPPGRITYAQLGLNGSGFGQTQRWVDQNGHSVDLRNVSSARLLPAHHKITISSDSPDAYPRLVTCWADEGSIAGCYSADQTYRSQLIVFSGDEAPRFRP